MEKISLVIDGRIIQIYYPQDERGWYEIIWDNISIGFMYVKELHEDLDTPLWVATTPHVEVYLDQLSKFIDSSNL